MDKQSEECSYCYLTLIALSIAFCSAVVTFLVANHMYTGLPCRDDPKPFAVKNEELAWNGSDRLVVASKRVIVVKLDDMKRCYILPSRLAQDTPRNQFEILPEPLSKAIGVHFAGQEGWNFCNSLPMYLLEESKRKPPPIPTRKSPRALRLRNIVVAFECVVGFYRLAAAKRKTNE